jgi:hypothetical protein
MSKSPDPLVLSINRCPLHGYWAVCIGRSYGSTRLTPGKCCGRWDTVREWEFDEAEAARLISAVADEAE